MSSTPKNAVKDAEQDGRASEGRGAAEQDGRLSEGREAAVKALEELVKKEGLKGLLSLFEKVEATRQEWEDFIPQIVLIACGAAETAVSESEDESEEESEDESEDGCSDVPLCCECGGAICEAKVCTCDARCDCRRSDDQKSDEEGDEEDD